jgi:hypothetical protein
MDLYPIKYGSFNVKVGCLGRVNRAFTKGKYGVYAAKEAHTD